MVIIPGGRSKIDRVRNQVLQYRGDHRPVGRHKHMILGCNVKVNIFSGGFTGVHFKNILYQAAQFHGFRLAFKRPALQPRPFQQIRQHFLNLRGKVIYQPGILLAAFCLSLLLSVRCISSAKPMIVLKGFFRLWATKEKNRSF